MNKPDYKHDSNKGLAGLIDGSINAEIAMHDGVARLSQPLLLQLKKQLLAIKPKGSGPTVWDRTTLLEVLAPISQLVHTLMDETLAPSPDDPEMKLSEAHISSQVLDELCVAIKDLDNGKVDARLKPGLGNRKHGIAQNNLKIILISAVNAHFKQLKKKGTPQARNLALHDVARAAQKYGYTSAEQRGGSQTIDATRLDSWTKRPPRKGK
jgi:hypothetical protein